MCVCICSARALAASCSKRGREPRAKMRKNAVIREGGTKFEVRAGEAELWTGRDGYRDGIIRINIRFGRERARAGGLLRLLDARRSR